MIKRYLEFIKENLADGFDSIGEWVESLYQDEYVKNIVNRYIGEIGSDIRLANAINLLDEQTQKEIKQQIEHYQEKRTRLLGPTNRNSLPKVEKLAA